MHKDEHRPRAKKVLSSDTNVRFLQNLQNCRSNTLRYKAKDDPLTKKTKPYVSETQEEEKEEEDDDEIETSHYEQFMDVFMAKEDGKQMEEDVESKLQGLQFDNMRNMGSDRCGYRSDVPPHKLNNKKQFVKTSKPKRQDKDDEACPSLRMERTYYSCPDVISLTLGKKAPRKKNCYGKTTKRR